MYGFKIAKLLQEIENELCKKSKKGNLTYQEREKICVVFC